MREYFLRSKERCWEIYGKYYKDGIYKRHNDLYRETIMQYLSSEMFLLDAGCGYHMEFTRNFSRRVRLAVGLDIEAPVHSGLGHSSSQGDLYRLPFQNSSFDIIICKSTLEHLADPEAVFDEFYRVLKKNGVVVLMTPNKYDYVSIIAKITPFAFHRWILYQLLNRREEDTFPTFFRANTTKTLRSLCEKSAFSPYSIKLFNQYPAYLMFSPLLFRLGIFYERLTTRYENFAQLRGWILAVLKKTV